MMVMRLCILKTASCRNSKFEHTRLQELNDILDDVNSNFKNYRDIIEAAYQRSLNYTVEKIYRYIQTDDDSLITWSNKHV